MPTPAPIPGPAGSAGAAGAPGPAPSGTGLVSVTGGVLDTPSTLSAQLAALGVAAPTILYASDFTVEPGGVSGGAASIIGVGAASTATLTIAATGSSYGSGGSNAPRIVLPLPVGARLVEAVVQCTATSGTGDTWRYLGFGLRNTANGGAPAALWGVGSQTTTSPNLYQGGILGGTNTGTGAATAYTNTGIFASDRWLRMTWRPTETYFGLLTGAGSAGARPTLWYPPSAGGVPINSAGYLAVGDDGSALALAIFFQSFGGSGTLTFTFKVTVKVWS